MRWLTEVTVKCWFFPQLDPLMYVQVLNRSDGGQQCRGTPASS
jgi:hypothetical protein